MLCLNGMIFRFYFTNHRAVIGSSDFVIVKKSKKLDYELEIACVIGREGRNISREQAEEYILVIVL